MGYGYKEVKQRYQKIASTEAREIPFESLK